MWIEYGKDKGYYIDPIGYTYRLYNEHRTEVLEQGPINLDMPAWVLCEVIKRMAVYMEYCLKAPN